jgi:ComF family protein
VVDLVTGFVELLWPRACAACGVAAPEPLCAACRRGLPWIEAGTCTLCQERPRARGATRCFDCAARRRPLAACVAGVRFEGVAANWIRAFKYTSPWRVSFGASERARIRTLAQASFAHAPMPAPDALVPIPLHRRRLRARGFNPALQVARELARENRVPVLHALTRSRDTPSQTGLGRADRRRNMAGAFVPRRDPPARVWLVDDVVTTGATLEAAARVLRRAGAQEVVGICLARTPPARSSGAPPERARATGPD